MFVKCKSCKKGIIAKYIADNVLLVTKRQKDFHPIKLVLGGKDYDVAISCTLCGESQFIECVNGKVIIDNLLMEEDHNGQPKPTIEQPNGDGKDISTNGDYPAPESGADPVGDSVGGDPIPAEAVPAS